MNEQLDTVLLTIIENACHFVSTIHFSFKLRLLQSIPLLELINSSKLLGIHSFWLGYLLDKQN